VADTPPAPPVDPPGIVARTARGALWVAAAEGSTTAAAIFAVLLGPVLLGNFSYGVASAVIVVLAGFDALTQAGFRQAVVQRRGVDDLVLDSAWTALIGRGVLLSAALFGGAPWVVHLFPDAPPDLVPMLRVASVALLLMNVHSAGVFVLTRDLDFRRLLALDVVPAITKTVIVVVVLLGWRTPWAYVFARVAAEIVRASLSYRVAPRRHRLRIDWGVLRELSLYGRWIAAGAAVGFLLTNLDNVLVGGMLGLGALGVYKIAYDVSQLPVSRGAFVLSRAAMPAFSRIQDRPEATKRLFRRTTGAAALIALPATAAVAVFVPDLVALFRPGYEEVVPLTRLLCLSVPFRLCAATANPLFQGIGRPDLSFRMGLARTLVLVAGFWGFAQWGLVGICWLVLLSAAAPLTTWGRGLRSAAGIRVRDAVAATGPGWLVAVAYGTSAALLRAQLPSGLPGALAAALGAAGVTLVALRVLARFGGWDAFGELQALRRTLRR
jgi:O-antigen/teichoic acid export membrane protein